MADTGESPDAIVEAEGLSQIGDADELEAVVRQAVAENPAAVSKYPRRQDPAPLAFPRRAGSCGRRAVRRIRGWSTSC